MQTRTAAPAACTANPVTGGLGFVAATPKMVPPTLKVTVQTPKTVPPTSGMPV
ncbi:MAG: hypothetical protein OXU31_01105 [Gammaproteobacteria bacterium]|nr:hypothetical protein [Gammaproteobacteria bacterium]